MIKITTDSTCDLPRELLERYNITVTPLGIIKAGKLYQDGVDIRTGDIAAHVDAGGEITTTNAVNVADYEELFRMISNAIADLKEHKSRRKQVYQENDLVSQRLKAASIAMSAYAAELTEWDQSVVYQLVEKVTVLAKDKIRVTFRNGTEVEQEIEQLDWRNAS